MNQFRKAKAENQNQKGTALEVNDGERFIPNVES